MNAYRWMWSAFLTAGLTSDPEAPELARYATGQALAGLKLSLESDRRYGFTTKGPLHIDAQVASVSATAVKISDCVDDSESLKYKPDGSLKDNVPGGRRKTEATVILVDATWKVSDLRLDGLGTC